MLKELSRGRLLIPERAVDSASHPVLDHESTHPLISFTPQT